LARVDPSARLRWLAGGLAGLAALLLTPQSAIAGFLLAAVLVPLSLPLMRRYAMARPNQRSGHATPTPQGAGAPVLAAALGATGSWVAAAMVSGSTWLMAIAAASVMLALVGMWDDLVALPALPRLAVQFAAAGLVLLAAPAGWRILPESLGAAVGLPAWSLLPAERLALLVAVVWFINLTNFMDGLDGITVANLVPPLATVALLAGPAGVSPGIAVLAGALAGALLGFLAFNWHPARCFLGDVGSLPLGLVTAVALLELAVNGWIVAALILPLYPVADSTLTLLGRWRRGERLVDAHRLHAYQKAADRGVPAMRISTEVAVVNTLLAGLAAATVMWPAALVSVAALALAIALTGALLARLRGDRKVLA
jgi:UDP-N-acetylmuramyl pentapeptide phosphotransferase/UDP-N-acetylglucosamine-1-phosphate transferase